MSDRVSEPCVFCAGTGYEDYPLNKIPCRNSSHQAKAEGGLITASLKMTTHYHPWQTSDGPCPYCNTNGPCRHWFGLGWNKDILEKDKDDKPRQITIDTHNQIDPKSWTILIGETDITRYVKSIELKASVNSVSVVTLTLISSVHLPNPIEAFLKAIQDD